MSYNEILYYDDEKLYKKSECLKINDKYEGTQTIYSYKGEREGEKILELNYIDGKLNGETIFFFNELQLYEENIDERLKIIFIDGEIKETNFDKKFDDYYYCLTIYDIVNDCKNYMSCNHLCSFELISKDNICCKIKKYVFDNIQLDYCKIDVSGYTNDKTYRLVLNIILREPLISDYIFNNKIIEKLSLSFWNSEYAYYPLYFIFSFLHFFDRKYEDCSLLIKMLNIYIYKGVKLQNIQILYDNMEKNIQNVKSTIRKYSGISLDLENDIEYDISEENEKKFEEKIKIIYDLLNQLK
jgi:hypothetical protein